MDFNGRLCVIYLIVKTTLNDVNLDVDPRPNGIYLNFQTTLKMKPRFSF